MRGTTAILCLVLGSLAGCDGPRSDESAARVRINLGDVPAKVSLNAEPADQSSIAPTVWNYASPSHVARYGPPDSALLTISCEGVEQHAARLVVVRYAAADRGAQALFAIQGSKGILRLPVSAVQMSPHGYVWRGVLDASDPRAEVLLGSGLKATVPGGGELDLPAMGAAGAVVGECAAAAPARPVQTLPNLDSNPDTSPEDR